MNILNRFHNDEQGTIIEWIVALLGLFFVGLAYSFTIPIGNVLIYTFVENGAPLADLLFIRQMSIWAFGIMGVMCLLYAFVASYVKTYDQGELTWGGR